MSAEKVCEIINKAFGKPFMPAGFVEAKVAFTLDGELFGEGTHCVSEWFDVVNSIGPKVLVLNYESNPLEDTDAAEYFH